MSTEEKYARFAIIELVLVVFSCIMLITSPELSWYPLLLAGLPLIIRVAWPDAPLRISAPDILVLAFLLTALIGLWISYNPEAAFNKFYLLVGAAFLYYSLSNQPPKNLWVASLILGVFGTLITADYLLGADWSASPADFDLINIVGQRWMAIRPQFNFHDGFGSQLFHANIVGGINGILLPLLAVTSVHSLQNKKKTHAVVGIFLFLLLALGLFISSSRAAWGAVVMGFIVLVLMNRQSFRSVYRSNGFLIPLILLLVVILGVTLPYVLSNNFNDPARMLVDGNSFTSRLRIAKQTYFLIADFPFTGGGLGSFPGLYSQYILVIPHLLFSYSHNLYLDLALEQGIIGLLLWVGIIIFAGITLKSTIFHPDSRPQNSLLASGLFASLIILLLHGIADDSLYSNVWGLPLFLAIPGLVLANINHQPELSIKLNSYRNYALVGGIIILSLFALFMKPLRTLWYSNLGAIQMAKFELADWPSGEWSDQSNPQADAMAEQSFTKALSIQGNNVTANYRYGLILTSQHKYQEAIKYLESAYVAAPDHRGIIKSLGYCYSWLGRFEEAQILLAKIPEAPSELETYSWWWQTKGRDDLAKNAAGMVAILTSSQ